MPLTKGAVLQGAEGLAENKHHCECLEARKSSSRAWRKEREGGWVGWERSHMPQLRSVLVPKSGTHVWAGGREGENSNLGG